MASTDDVVLREQIRALKAQQQSIKEQKLKLEKSIQASDMRCNALKMEANILMALDEVRFQELEDSALSHSCSTHDDGLRNRQFIERNLKLELQILNSELKQSLPKLEKAAIKIEDMRNKVSEELEEHKKKMKSLPIQSSQQLDKQEAELMSKKQLLHEQIEKQHKDAMKERSANQRALTQLRAKVKRVDDDLSFERDRAYRIKKILLEEQGKIEFLRQQHSLLREELQPFHGGKGWQTEAFLANTSSLHGSIHISQLPSIINQWLPSDGPGSEEDGSEGGGITAEDIEDTLHQLGEESMNNSQELNCEQFIVLCDALVATLSS